MVPPRSRVSDSRLRPDIWFLFHAHVVTLRNEQMRRGVTLDSGSGLLELSRSPVYTGPGPPEQAQSQGHSPLTPHTWLILHSPADAPHPDRTPHSPLTPHTTC